MSIGRLGFLPKPPYLFCKLSYFCEPNGSVAPFGAVRHAEKTICMLGRKETKN